jgi:uncharacterized membrane protein YfcA
MSSSVEPPRRREVASERLFNDDARTPGQPSSPQLLDHDGEKEWRNSGVGFVSSFLGIGGGVIHVPLLVRALGFPTHIATGTSHFVLANMAAVGTVTHIVTGDFAGGTGIHRALAPSLGVVIGAQLGAWVSQRIQGPIIQRLLAVALAALAVRLLVGVVQLGLGVSAVDQ